MKRYKSYNVKTETLESYCHFGFEKPAGQRCPIYSRTRE